MEVHVVDAPRRLARQARCIEIVDVVVLAIEQVEDIELYLYLLAERVADARVHERGGLRAHAVVLDQRPRSEIAPAQRAKPAVTAFDRYAGGSHAIGGPGYVVPRRLAVAKTRRGDRKPQVD